MELMQNVCEHFACSIARRGKGLNVIDIWLEAFSHPKHHSPCGLRFVVVELEMIA
jgi:hypothetical protein